jgi:nucleotidyltransferase substrate binding protein (TIGR01987 family)
VEKLSQYQQKFVKSLNALDRSIKLFSHENIKADIKESLVASNIKHFEMCYEAAWKFLKQYLEVQYSVRVDSPKKVFRECFALGIISNKITEELLNISEARNATTHDYDEETAQETCKRINDYYLTLKLLLDISI